MRLLTASPRRLAALFVTVMVGLSLLAAAVVQAAHPRGSITSATAARLLHTALADATATGSFHSVEHLSVAGSASTVTADAARTVGRQRLTSVDGGRAQVLVIDRVAYISGNRGGWLSTLGFPAVISTFMGNGAVSITPSSSSYGPVAAAVTLQSALAQFELHGHLTAAPATFAGHTVTAITGRAPAADGGGEQTVYVSRTSHPLPVYVKLGVTENGKHGSGSITLGEWGERVSLERPAYPVSVTALPAVIVAADGAGMTGYKSFAGPNGATPPAGRPWVGTQCKPIRLDASRAVPAWAYTQISDVVSEARTDGIDVTLDSRSGAWKHDSLYYRKRQSARTAAIVPIGASEARPTKSGGHIMISYGTKRSGSAAQLTHVAGTLVLREIRGNRRSLRRAVRQLIALTQGVAGTTVEGSAIANYSATDHFTTKDIAALLQSSGCVQRSSTPISGLGNTPTTVTTPLTSPTGVPFKWK